ncbi:hypothetical protein ACLB1T_22155 [Escherichia coli]
MGLDTRTKKFPRRVRTLLVQCPSIVKSGKLFANSGHLGTENAIKTIVLAGTSRTSFSGADGRCSRQTVQDIRMLIVTPLVMLGLRQKVRRWWISNSR